MLARDFYRLFRVLLFLVSTVVGLATSGMNLDLSGIEIEDFANLGNLIGNLTGGNTEA